MYYRSKKIALTGATGFLGAALRRRLEEEGALVGVLSGDVRLAETFKYVDYSYDYIFHFADPSSQILFGRQAGYAAETTILGFLHAARAAKRSGSKLIYPSTGLLSQGRQNEYARCKQICEDIHLGENLDAIGIRLFAAYGPGEAHKRDYASVPYLFARDMLHGRSPVVWGDGNQARDFIYIDDAVDGILHIAEEATENVIDLGSGSPVTFNEVISHVRDAFQTNCITAPEPVYVDRPANYVQETVATRDSAKYYAPRIDIRTGIVRLVEDLVQGGER